MNKATTTAADGATSQTATWLTALKAAAFLVVTIQMASFVYGFFWKVFSYEDLETMLGVWRVADYSKAAYQILALSFAPLMYALLFVLAPLVGWWIYSRIEQARQSAVGWSTVGFFMLANAIILIFSGMTSIVVLVLGNAILGLYAMFWMGIGFNLAKLFRIRL